MNFAGGIPRKNISKKGVLEGKSVKKFFVKTRSGDKILVGPPIKDVISTTRKDFLAVVWNVYL